MAEDFYLELMNKKTRGELKKGKTFKDATTRFLREYKVITEGQRSVRYVEGISFKITDRAKRNNPRPDDKVFPSIYPDLFNIILAEAGLMFDRESNRRTAYSLRHTYICLRLTEGADIYQIARDCRASVEMIEKYYAAHIASSLDASAINVRRSKKFPPEKSEPSVPGPRNPQTCLQPLWSNRKAWLECHPWRKSWLGAESFSRYRDCSCGRGEMVDARDLRLS